MGQSLKKRNAELESALKELTESAHSLTYYLRYGKGDGSKNIMEWDTKVHKVEHSVDRACLLLTKAAEDETV